MENIQKKRHSLAHLLAAAVLKNHPSAQLTIGPATDNGFYYDVDFINQTITTDSLKTIHKTMTKLISKWTTFEKQEVTATQAKEIFADNKYKLELIAEIQASGEQITVYKSGDFLDLCKGGHVESMKEIEKGSYKLDTVAGAYWRGKEENTMLTRIYGLAFETPQELKDYLLMREEAKKRDHKKLGKEMGLFAFSERVGKGLPLFLPKGTTVKELLGGFVRKEKEKLGYKFVSSPHIAKRDLYETSGHMGKYDAMMPVMKDQHGDECVMKAMNCPHHFEMYNAQQHSYKDLPLRFAENGTVYRNEKSGELSGLLRVKALTQDDTHHFVREDQIGTEIDMILDLMRRVYEKFNFTDYKVEISVRDPKNKDKYFGEDELWSKAEQKLIEAVKKNNLSYSIEKGEAAFYGPKIDVQVKDAIGRSWQLTTVQLDFNQPQNFDMNYIGQDGQKHKVVVLHVAILGSLERFMGVIIEHFAGHFPSWLAPTQIAILPVSPENHGTYAKEIFEELKKAGIRSELLNENESLGKRIRKSKTDKNPYLIVIGDNEIESKVFNLEGRESKEENLNVKQIIELVNNQK